MYNQIQNEQQSPDEFRNNVLFQDMNHIMTSELFVKRKKESARGVKKNVFFKFLEIMS